jgi:monothiol glutaredoxin
MELKEKIQNELLENPVILYMKGTRDMPMCGFSFAVVEALNQYEVEYKTVNVLEDPEIRVSLSEISKWPTIPQLFVNSQLVGGCDITLELHQSGELEKVLSNAKSSTE